MEVGGGGRIRGVGVGGVGVGEMGSRNVTLPPPTPTVFPAANPYSTSHVSHQIVLASSRLCIKSLASSLFALNCHVPRRWPRHSLHASAYKRKNKENFICNLDARSFSNCGKYSNSRFRHYSNKTWDTDSDLDRNRNLTSKLLHFCYYQELRIR